MVQIEGEIVIDRPADEVFDFVVDERNEPSYNPRIIAAPLAAGTRMRWAWEVRLRGWHKLLTPMIARSGRRQEQATWANLKHFLGGQRDRLPTPR